jgi:hypothetical protein
MGKAKSKSRKGCPHCKSGAETYRCKYHGQRYLYDISRARELVLDGREAVEIDEESIRLEVAETRIHREHLPHVETKYPGIIAHVWFPMKDGELAHGHLLIDGNHRAARCLQLGLPYYAYILTEEESLQILLKGPDLSPWFGSLAPFELAEVPALVQ